MKLKVVVFTLFVFSMFSPMLFAAKFRCGLQKTETTLSIPRPPDVLIRDRNIQVLVVETPRTLDRDDGNRIRREVEQALSPDFNISNSPETIFRIYVVNYDSDIKQYTQTEERRVVVGKECTTDKNGKERCSDKYEKRNVSVRYWEANANINWRVEVTDSSGFLIDSAFNPRDSYTSKKELSINGVSQYAASLPDAAQIKNQMIANTAKKFIKRYRKTYDYLTVEISCSAELKPGNELVKNSDNNRSKDWEGALKLWEAAAMKKNENEGDRLYNMAVAYEALAFKAYDASGVPADADPQFNKALELYEQAMILDPKEKYIQKAAERLRTSKNNLGRAKDHMAQEEEAQRQIEEARLQEEEAQRELEEARRQVEEARRQATARPETEDTSAEGVFRTYIRARLGNLDVMDDEEVVSMARGKFKLDENQALRVFDQEIDLLNQKVERFENIKKYQEDFEIFVMDGLITKDERDVLNAIAESLSLTEEDIKTAESEYVFKDESAAPAKKSAPRK